MSKGKRYCSIQKWIEENDKKLFDFLEDNCLLGIFKFRHGTSGVTFLHPKNWKDIEKDIESGDYVNGVNTLKAHVLQGYYPNLDGLIEQQDGLVNALGQLVEVDKKAGNVVQLKNKAKVSESKFAGTPDRTNINVFHYDGDLLPTNGPAGSLKYTSAPSGKKSKSGGGFSGMNKLSKTKMVEQCALNLIRQGKYELHNPYAAAVVSLYAFAMSQNRQTELNSLLDVFPENAFYAIVLPYGPASASLDELIQLWLDKTGGIYTRGNPCQDYLKVLELAGAERSAVQVQPIPGKNPLAIVNGVYKGDKVRQRRDELRWFISLRRSENPALFENPHTFITLVYDLAVIFSNPDSAHLYADPTSSASIFPQSRYIDYSFLRTMPATEGQMPPVQATAESSANVSGGGWLVTPDENEQLGKLGKAAEAAGSGDPMGDKFAEASRVLAVLGQ